MPELPDLTIYREALVRLQWESGTLTLTEAGTKRRASLHLVSGQEALRQQDPGGLEVLAATAAEFTERLRSENHTLKRALTVDGFDRDE